MKATKINKGARALAKNGHENLALMTAMKKGLKSGIATVKDKDEFELWLSETQNRQLENHFSDQHFKRDSDILSCQKTNILSLH